MNKRTAFVLASAVTLTTTVGVSAALVGTGSNARPSRVAASGAATAPPTALLEDPPAVHADAPVSHGAAPTAPTPRSASPTTVIVVDPRTTSTTAPPPRPGAQLAPAVRFESFGPVENTPSPVDTQPTPDMSACQNPTGTVHPATQAEFEAKIERAWMVCTPPSVFGTREAGMEIRPDHRWSKLDLQDGRLVREQGWGNEGSWDVVDTSSMNGPGYWQLNLDIDGTGTVVTMPDFAASTPVMRLDNEGVYTADYIPASTAGVAGP